jgi:hypothetical protein
MINQSEGSPSIKNQTIGDSSPEFGILREFYESNVSETLLKNKAGLIQEEVSDQDSNELSHTR